MYMQVVCATDVGLARPTNQDVCECGIFSENSAWGIVCDGMGGASGGNIASSVAAEKLRGIVTREYRDSISEDEIKSIMEQAMQEANRSVYEAALKDEALKGMGTTAVVMIAYGDTLHVAHVGDSRAYVKNGSGFFQVTEDHSYVQELVNFGQITKNEAKNHPQKNIITRVLGVHDMVECDYNRVDFQEGSCALACSDGLSNYTEDNLLLEYVEKYKFEKLPQQLIKYAKKAGGADNITVAMIKNA